MKNITRFLIAGAMVASVAFAQTTDAGAAARVEAKTGRAAAVQTETTKCCGMKTCCCADKCCGGKMCHREEKTSASVSHTDAEQRFFAKNGQYPPSAEATTTQIVQAATGETGAMHMDCCRHHS